MEKNEWLKVVGFIGAAIMLLAVIGEGEIAPYITQAAFLVYVILYAYKKVTSKVIVLAGSALLFILRLITFSGSYDLIDLGLWGIIFGLAL